MENDSIFLAFCQSSLQAAPLPVILRRARTSMRLEISAPKDPLKEEMLLEQRKEEAIEQLLNGLHFFSPLQLLLFQGVLHPARGH